MRSNNSGPCNCGYSTELLLNKPADTVKIVDSSEPKWYHEKDFLPEYFMCDLPNGSRLYVKSTEIGSWEFFSDSIGGGVRAFDTMVGGKETLRAIGAWIDQHGMGPEDDKNKEMGTFG